MARYQVTRSAGNLPETIEADVSMVDGSGALTFWLGNLDCMICAFAPGTWATVQRIADERDAADPYTAATTAAVSG